jgi:hypothetical protein
MSYNKMATMATATQYQTAPQKVVTRAPNQETAPQSKGVKGGPVLFWLVAGIAVGADIVDIFTSLLGLAALGLQIIPIVGTAAGMAIGAFSIGINVVSGLFINFTMFTYFAYIGGSLGRRLAVMSIGAIMELIPGLEVLPLTTAMFFLAYSIGKIKILQTGASFIGTGKKLLHT